MTSLKTIASFQLIIDKSVRRNAFDGMQTQTSYRTLAQTLVTTGAEQRVGAFSMLPTLLRQLGVDPMAALSEAGLEKDALDDPENRIPYVALGRLLRATVALTGCTHFGLLAGRVWRISDLGIVGELIRNSPTVGEALRKLVFYQHLNSGGAVAFLREAGNVVDLGCAVYVAELAGVEEFCDAYLAAAVNFLRELCGSSWTPTEVLLSHAARGSDRAQYRQYFKVQPRFNAEFCALRFPAHWMARPVEGADPARLRGVEREARAKGSPQLLQQVYRALRILLLNGLCSGDDVAKMLSMHRRTLNRRLKAHGTTFQVVLDQLRYEVACQLLGGSEISLDDTAAVLGYAGVSPFMRSFRRWSGTTPGQWRRLARRGERFRDAGSEHHKWSRIVATLASHTRATTCGTNELCKTGHQQNVSAREGAGIGDRDYEVN